MNTTMMTTNNRVLVAGLGNRLFGDDGFGVEVTQRLLSHDVPPGIVIRSLGVHVRDLVYELLSGFRLAILVDTVARGYKPGTVAVIEPDVSWTGHGDSHGFDLASVCQQLGALGTTAPEFLLVGCEPAQVVNETTGLMMGLSQAVGRAVDVAAAKVPELWRAAQAGWRREGNA